MKNIFRKTLKKPTLFFILGITIIIIGLPIGLYGLTLSGGGSLGGVLILLGIFIVAVIVIIDRLFATKFKSRKINQVELILLLIGIICYSFKQREILIDLSDKKTDYFILIENNGTLINSKLNYSFPFDKKMSFHNNIAIINSITKNYQQLTLDSPNNWNSKRMQTWNMNDFKIRFYSNGNLKFNKTVIDSILKKEIKTITLTTHK